MTIKIKTILKKLLHEQDMTSAQLARATSVPPQTINNWLSGLEPRSLGQIKIVADYFGASVDYLVYGVIEQKQFEPFKEYADEINAGTFEVVLRSEKSVSNKIAFIASRYLLCNNNEWCNFWKHDERW